MKLHAEHANPRIERLDRLDDSIARAGRRTESGRHIAHGLMMERVRPQRIRPGNPSHERLFGYGYRMRRLARGQGLAVADRTVGILAGQVLVQRSAESHIDQLLAAANAQHGNIPTQSKVKQREIVCVANRVDMPQRSGGLRIETGRIDVASSDQHQTVEPFKQTAQAGRIPHQRNDDGDYSGRLHGIDVSPRNANPAFVARLRHADQRRASPRKAPRTASDRQAKQ